MKKLRSILPALGLLILAVASLAGCCGVGYCEESEAPKKLRASTDIHYLDDIHVLKVFEGLKKTGEKGSITPEELKEAMNNLSPLERIMGPVICGYAYQASEKDRVLEDLEVLNDLRDINVMIDEWITLIEQFENRQLLYFNSSELGLVPLKSLLAGGYECSLDFEKRDSVFMVMVKDMAEDFGPDSEEFSHWAAVAAKMITSRYANTTKALSVLEPYLESVINSSEVSPETACAFVAHYVFLSKKAGHYRQSLKYALKYLEMAEKYESYNDMYYANKFLGQLYTVAGKFDEAEEHFLKASTLCDDLQKFLHNSYDHNELLRAIGSYQEALDVMNELASYLDREEIDDGDRLAYYENLGIAYTPIDPGKAAEAFRKAEEYKDALSGEGGVRHILNSQIYLNDDNSFMIISALSRAYLAYNVFVVDNPTLFNELSYLMGHYLVKIRDYDKAHYYLWQAFTKSENYFKTDPLLFKVVHELAHIYKRNRDNHSWGWMTERMLTFTDSLKPETPRRLEALSNAVDLSIANGDLFRADSLLTLYPDSRKDGFNFQSLLVRLALAREDYDGARQTLMRLDGIRKPGDPSTDDLWIDLLSRAKDPELAVYARRRFERDRDDLLRQLLFMSPEERRNLNDDLERRRREVIDLIEISPELKKVAMDYSLLIKGLLFKTQTTVKNYLSRIPEARKEYEFIKNLRKDLNRAESQGNDSLYYELKSEIQSRERYIIDDYVNPGLFHREFMANTVDSLRKTIKPGTAYIDVVSLGKRNNPRFGLFIINSCSDDVEFKILEKEDLIRGEGLKIWSKLDPYLEGAREIFFCPDGEFARAPVESGIMVDENLPKDKYRIHRVFQLCDIRPATTIGDEIGIIGVSDYNSPVGEGETLYRGKLTDLPAVKTEIQSISERLKSFKPKVLFNDDAVETAVKELDGSDVSLLHFSTHAFFRSPSSMVGAFEDSLHNDHYMAKRRLIDGYRDLSGIVLRRGNLSWKAPVILDEEDDILTADEIETMSFPNLRLTVLSACETGLGSYDSEGVWGLQRAFRIAGTQSLICSLRKVDDYWTAQFMDVFYEHAARGETIYDSFHAAQRWLHSELPDNPEIWASFILIE